MELKNLEQSHTQIETMIFGKLSSEIPNVGKPVQQMRVLLLCSNRNYEYNKMDAKLEILFKRNTRKSI